MDRLAILLATYNSSKYLEQQLDSLFTQTYSDFILYVRDDGSKDDTLDIILKYQEKHNIVIFDDVINGRGAMGSFMWMLENVDADYYMFCDHDDVWLPNKIERVLIKISEYNDQERPIAICSDLKIVDENLSLISDSMWSYMKQRPQMLLQKKYAISTNLFTGCTMIINNAAKKVAIPISPMALMHDHWIGLRVMASNGIVDYINEPLILYRQHGNNVCGIANVGTMQYYKERIFGLVKLFQSWHSTYRMSYAAFNGNLNIIYYYFWKIAYLILR